MSIAIETERKFLLKNIPNIEYDDIINITQHYLSIDNTWERYRKSEHSNGIVKYHRTIKKFIEIGSHEEDEVELDRDTYTTLIELCYSGKYKQKIISKERHVRKINESLKWEIDKFHNMSMVIAEIEIPNMDYKFDIPDWLDDEIIMEVTEYKQFSSKSLANKL